MILTHLVLFKFFAGASELVTIVTVRGLLVTMRRQNPLVEMRRQ